MTIDFNRGIDIITPAGTLKWPFLQKPATNFNKDGVFSTKLVLTPDDAKNLTAQLDKLYQENLVYQAKKKDLNKVQGANKQWGPELDYKTKEPTGNIEIATKANAKRGTYDFRPKIFEADGKPFERPAAIGSGTTAKLSLRVRGYYAQGKAGLTLGVEAAQILKLVQAGKNSAEDYGFTPQDMPQDDTVLEENKDY